MTYPILVEPTPERGYVATALGMPDCAFTANTEEEAIRGLRVALAGRLAKAKLVQVEIPGAEDPWAKWIGRFAADASWDEFQALMALARGAVLVTPNVADFVEIPGLKIEDWGQ